MNETIVCKKRTIESILNRRFQRVCGRQNPSETELLPNSEEK